MQARYYDPVIGRFYSNDPVDALGHMQRGNPVHGFNRYAYANNNPYKYTDPTGMTGESTYEKEVIKPEYKTEIASVDVVITKDNINGSTTSSSLITGTTTENAAVKIAGPIEFGASKDNQTGKTTYEAKIGKQIGPDKANVTPSVAVNSQGELIGAVQVKVGKGAIEVQGKVNGANFAHNAKTLFSKFIDTMKSSVPSGR